MSLATLSEVRPPVTRKLTVFLAPALIVVLGLVVAVAYVVHVRVVERRLVRVTRERLTEVARFARSQEGWHVSSGHGPKVVFSVARVDGFFVFSSKCAGDVGGGELLRDQWGGPVIYREPGPVHNAGWDLYSVGPNGVDESGDGDDILVGEDAAPVTTGPR